MKQFIYNYGYGFSHSSVYWYFHFGVALLLDDSTIKGAIYISLWVLFYAVTTVTSYVRYCNRKRK